MGVYPRTVNFGSVPDWLSGAGAILALIFAFFAVRSANITNVQQGLQLAAMQEDRRQAHAAVVAAWPIEDDSIVRCRLHNGSDLPIFGVLLFRGLEDESGYLWWYHERSRVVSPGDTEYEWSHDNFPFIPKDASNANSHLAAIAFLDCRGKYWLRDCFGLLHPLTASPDLYSLPPREWVRHEDNAVLKQLTGG